LWFSPGTLVSSTNKTDRHDITEMLLKVVLKTA
jgi:cobalamin-dependent methionine synthase I